MFMTELDIIFPSTAETQMCVKLQVAWSAPSGLLMLLHCMIRVLAGSSTCTDVTWVTSQYCFIFIIVICVITAGNSSNNENSLSSIFNHQALSLHSRLVRALATLHRGPTRSSAIAEGPRDASCQLRSCQLPGNSAETTYTTSPDLIDGMRLEI